MARIEICPGKGKLQCRLLGGWDADEKACDWAEARRADKIWQWWWLEGFADLSWDVVSFPFRSMRKTEEEAVGTTSEGGVFLGDLRAFGWHEESEWVRSAIMRGRERWTRGKEALVVGWYFATCSMWGVFWKGFLQGVCTEVDGEKFFRKVSELLNAVSRDMYIYIYIFLLTTCSKEWELDWKKVIPNVCSK